VNDGYFYGDGLNNRFFIMRKRENGQAVETRADVRTLDPSFRIANRIYSADTPGLIFVIVQNSSSEFYLLKSSDGGATVKKVFAFGEGNGPQGTNVQNVRMLRGLLELERDIPSGGGKGTLYIGEYNFNKTRIPGSINDRIRIMKSTDNGDTWVKVVEWNTNGQNQIGHIHAMKQDPYTGEIYICIGDSDTSLGIVKWDGSSQWPDNRTMTQLSSIHGFKVLTGKQRYRSCDILFGENYFYSFADTQLDNNPTGSESGIWKGAKDFSSFTRVDNQIYDYDPMHIGWLGEKIGNTFIFTTAREYVTPAYAWKELNTQVYISNDGEHWKVTGSLGWRDKNDPTSTAYTPNVFSYNNKLYIDCADGAGFSATIRCEVRADSNPGDGPVSLHPVYFLGKWNTAGNDSNPGNNADSPKASLGSLLASVWMTSGARIRVSSGTFKEQGIVADWSHPYFPGRGSVTIEGKGMDSTRFNGQGPGKPSGIRIDTSLTSSNRETPFVMKDLEFSVPASTGTDHRNYVIDITDAYVRTIRCRIGNKGNDDSPLIRLKNNGANYASVKSIHDAGEKAGIFRTILSAEAASSFSFTNCFLINAYNALPVNHEHVDINLVFSTFYSIEKSAVILGNKFDRQPFIKNCLFSCGSAPVEDQSGIVETQIDYNYYSKPNINVTDGGHSPQAGKDPLFVDPAKGDFRIYANSPAANDGLLFKDIPDDITGKARHNPPSIGAFESINESATGIDNANENQTGNGSETGNGIGNETGSTTGNGTENGNTGGNETGSSNETGSTNENTDGGTPVDYNDSTGIDPPESQPDRIYPNPVTDILTIENNSEEISFVTIFDTSGKVWLKEKPSSRNFTLDFAGYQRGVYLIEVITSSNKIKRVKIIKK
jgi:hypothetical protein